MSIILWDCETTGLPKRDVPLSDESQPRIIGLAAILCDDEGNITDSMDTLIYHPGLEIPEFITKINGITQERCESQGIPMIDALAKYNDMKSRSTVRVAHNISFDKQMIARETLAAGQEHFPYHGESFCTMAMCRTLGMKGNLTAMYNALFGRDFIGTHTAMGDVLACKEIFFKVRVK
jgi:DNA polymerase III epsilon subunit-like protein